MLSLTRSRLVPFLPTPTSYHLRTTLLSLATCHCTCRSFVSAIDKDDDKRPKRRGRPAKSATSATITPHTTPTPISTSTSTPSSVSPSVSPSPSSSPSTSTSTSTELTTPKRKGRPPKPKKEAIDDTSTSTASSILSQPQPVTSPSSLASPYPSPSPSSSPLPSPSSSPSQSQPSTPPSHTKHSHSHSKPTSKLMDVDIISGIDIEIDVDVDEDDDEDTPRRRTGKYTLPTYISPTAIGDTIPVVADVNERPTPTPTSTTITHPSSTSAPKLGRPPLPFPSIPTQPEYHDLSDVIIINTGSMARAVIQKLMSSPICDEYHAVDTETINIDPRTQSPVGNGTMTCLSIYCGPHHDFSSLLPSPSSTPRSKIWIDIIDHDGCDMIEILGPYIENENIKKVWHNYSFDRHILENHGLKPRGFGGDTMHMARLFDSSRDSYSLESLTHDLLGNRKRPIKERFAKPHIKKDGSIGKAVILPDVLTLQRDETTRSAWIDYSTRDTQLTWELRERLHTELNKMEWAASRTMWDFYHTHLRPFGELLCDLETVGIYIRRDYLPIIQTHAERDREQYIQTFREWAMKYQRAAKYMNITSSAQKQQFFFAPPDSEREFSTENTESYIEEGKTKPLKMFKFKLKGMGLPYTSVTAKQIPSVSMPTLRQLAGSPDSDPPKYGPAYDYFGGGERGHEACVAIHSLCKVSAVTMMLNTFIKPLQETADPSGRIHCSLNLNTETGRLSSRRPNLQNQPALEKDIYRVRDAFAAEKGNMLIVADYGQLELRVLAHMTNCKSMIEAFKLGGDFHSRTAMGMYPYIADAVNKGEVILEWDKSKGAPPAPLLKDVYASERRKAKTLNFSIAYGKTARGLSADWGVSVEEATATLNRWFADRPEVKQWQEETIAIAHQTGYTRTLMGRYRRLIDINSKNMAARSHAERAAINTPVQGGGADIVMKAMLKLHAHQRFRELNWKIILQIHDEIICEGPQESTDEAMSIVRECMAHPFVQPLLVDLTVDAKAETTWYKAK